MADPRQIFQDPLKAYGLGLGGLRSKIGKERSPFAEEGPSSTGIKSVEQQFSDDPLSGLNREEAIDYIESLGINTKNPSGAFEQLVSRANKRPEEIFTSEIQSLQPDAVDFSEFANSYSDVMSAIKPDAASASKEELKKDALRIENMPNNSTAFDESGLDQIAATLAEAQTPSFFNAGDAMAAGQAGAATDSPILTEGEVTQEQADEGFLSAIDDFLEAAVGTGPGKPKERTIEEYKKVFSEATGIDTSGKVDKSDALMAFGLALMQNKAGKGFNVGKMLQSAGEAGDKALPALTKAKAEAKKAGLAAGQYALTAKNSDKAKDEVNAEKAKKRSDYYIVPKSKGISGFLANMDQGQLESLNSFELDALMTNNSFRDKFDVLPGGTWSGIVSEAMKTPEAEALYLTKDANKISLIPGVENDLFTIKTFSADPNVKGNEGRPARLDGNGQEQYRALAAASQDLQRAKEKFMEGFGLAEGTSAFRFTLDKVDSLAGAFGINVDGIANSTEKLKLFLNKLKAQNAKEILGEAGKTISDADRLLVESIVGNVSVLTNPDVLAEKMSQLYNDVILKKERDIFSALQTLDRYSNRNISSRLGGGELNAEEQAELNAAIASIGEKNG
mgnify:FL=1